MPNAPSPITSPPAVQGQPYDACSDAPVGPWVKPTDIADFDDAGLGGADGPAPWRQT